MKVVVKGIIGEVPDNCTYDKCQNKGTRCIHGKSPEIVLNKTAPWPFWVCSDHVNNYIQNGYIEIDWKLVQ
jgi:hypothetical protein